MKRIVVIGAGFGGLLTLKKILNLDCEFILVHPKDYFLFTPKLVDLFNNPNESKYTIAKLKDVLPPTVKHIQEKATYLDMEKKELKTEHQTLKYDYLVLAAGTHTNFFGLKGTEHALQYKEYEDIERTKKHVDNVVQQINTHETDALKTFVVIGAGPTGVEVVFELNTLVRKRIKDAKVLLINSREEPVGQFGSKIAKKTATELNDAGITMLTNTRVVELTKDEVVTKNTRIPATTKIWAAGVRPNDLACKPPLENSKGRIVVADTLQIVDHPNVFAVGDNCAGKAVSVPQTAQAAIQEAEHAAANIRRLFAGQELAPFQFRDKGHMLLMDDKAIVKAGPIVFNGFLGGLFRKLYYRYVFRKYTTL